jgi:uroporphyrinogen decarboxylase
MICDGIQNKVPVTVFAKDAHYAVKDIAKINCNTIGLDWTMNPEKARIDAGANKTLQGNADPCLLYADENTIETETINMLKKFGKKNYIANLGHGLYPDTEKSKIKFFVDVIKSYSFN